jgi:hypothetical protein
MNLRMRLITNLAGTDLNSAYAVPKGEPQDEVHISPGADLNATCRCPVRGEAQDRTNIANASAT